ncbi:MAG: phosphoribosylformylglycinamidine cyclo-ligase [Shimia sp.]
MTIEPSQASLTYAEAGVDIDAGERVVAGIGAAVEATQRPGVMSALGGFGGLFDLKAAGFSDPILVAATDGVGTKLRIGIETGQLDGLGQDLVAMCVNDLICQGAEPLFFLDYFATGKLDPARTEAVVKGIAAACAASGCALIGGETAEMPGMYAAGDFDLAGFAVGAMERGVGLPRDVDVGDVLIGLAASGPHSNGFSLIRRVAERAEIGWADPSPWDAGTTLGTALLAPTMLYVEAARAAAGAGGLHALAHITGGGLTENLPRVLPEGLGATLDLDAWVLPPVFAWLREAGNIAEAEMLRTFNCGIGLVAVTAPEAVEATLSALSEAGYDAGEIGRVEAGDGVRYSGTL